MNNIQHISTLPTEMKLSNEEEQTPRRSYEGLDASELECPITRLRDTNFGVLFPCLHDLSVSGILSLENRSCPLCRSEIEGYESLIGLDNRIENTKSLLEKMEKAREKIAKINRINGEHLVGHANERNDVKAACRASALREGDLPRLFGEEIVIDNPDERNALIRAQVREIALSLVDEISYISSFRALKKMVVFQLVFVLIVAFSSSNLMEKLENTIVAFLGDYFINFN